MPRAPAASRYLARLAAGRDVNRPPRLKTRSLRHSADAARNPIAPGPAPAALQAAAASPSLAHPSLAHPSLWGPRSGPERPGSGRNVFQAQAQPAVGLGSRCAASSIHRGGGEAQPRAAALEVGPSPPNRRPASGCMLGAALSTRLHLPAATSYATRTPAGPTCQTCRRQRRRSWRGASPSSPARCSAARVSTCICARASCLGAARGPCMPRTPRSSAVSARRRWQAPAAALKRARATLQPADASSPPLRACPS